MTSANEFFLHNFRLRTVEEFPPQSFFDFRVTTRNRIANNDTVRRGREMFAFVSVGDVDAQFLEHRRHWWIDVQIGTSNVMPARLKHAGQRSHRGSANS